VAELHARGAAALAAYRLKRRALTREELRRRYVEEGYDVAAFTKEEEARLRHKMAAEYARHVVETAHGDYTQLNAPKLVNILPGGMGNLIFQFKKFMLIQLFFVADLFRDAFKTARTPEEKAAAIVARKQLGLTFAVALATTGMLGLPGATAALYLTSLLGGDDEFPGGSNSVRLRLRAWLGDNADVVLHGLPALAGLNMTEALGFGNVGIPLPYAQVEMSKDGLNQLLVAMLGPTAGTFGRIMDGFKLVSQGDLLTGLRELSPSGLRGLIDELRYHVQDGLRTNKGRTIVQEGDLSLLQQLYTAFGFPALKVSRNRDIYFAVRNLERDLDERQRVLLRHIYEAYRRGDEPTDLIEELRHLQEIKAKFGIRPLRAATTRRAIMARARNDKRFLHGVPIEPRSYALVDRLLGVSAKPEL